MKYITENKKRGRKCKNIIIEKSILKIKEMVKIIFENERCFIYEINPNELRIHFYTKNYKKIIIIKIILLI